MDCFWAFFIITGPLARSDVGRACPHPIPWCAPGVPGSAPAGMCGAVPGEAHARGSHRSGLGQEEGKEESETQAELGAVPTLDPVRS